MADNITYVDPKFPFLIFGDGYLARILKREGKYANEFLLEPTKALKLAHKIKDEEMVEGRAIEFKCDDPENIIEMNKDYAHGMILCLTDFRGKATNTSRDIVKGNFLKTIKRLRGDNEALSLQLQQQQEEVKMIITNKEQWIKDQEELKQYLTGPNKRDDYDEVPHG